MNTEKTYTIKNRSTSRVVYTIPEDGIRREFGPGETKKITYGELEKLSFQPGGRNLMQMFLQIVNEEVTESLNIHTEPEYYMSEEQVAELIKSGSLAQFLDCLDFAPVGVIDIVKRLAVDLPMTDTQKINALKEKTGFDAEKAIAMKRAEQEPETATTTTTVEKTATTATGRRTTTTYKTEETTTVETPSYKIVSE